jgi:hypothetical protein
VTEADHVPELFNEPGIRRELEVLDLVRLDSMRLPDARDLIVTEPWFRLQ